MARGFGKWAWFDRKGRGLTEGGVVAVLAHKPGGGAGMGQPSG